MKRKRSTSNGPSVIDQALASFKERWLAVESTVDEIFSPAMRPVVPIPRAASASAASMELGASGEAVSELRIRLAGFGGLLPGEDFDGDTEDSVKQFEKDVMKRAETGIVDTAFAAALDKFAADWPIDVEKELACPCVAKKRLQGCTGFGKGQFKGEYSPKYQKSRDEAGHKYEYPGIHRSLLWAARALMFYATLDHKDAIQFLKFSSGYRCHKDNEAHNRTSTNHMGKAVDIQFSHRDGGKLIVPGKSQAMKDADAMREVAQSRMGAQVEWLKPGRFSLEPGGEPDKKHPRAPTWVHMDVRTWASNFREDSFFVQGADALDGISFSILLGRPGSFSSTTQ